MKRTFHLILVLMMISFAGYAEKASFMIMVSQSCDTKDPAVAASIQVLEINIFNEIRKKLPCADVNMLSGIHAMVGFNRTQQLLGAGEDMISEISGAMGVNYLVILNVSRLNQTLQQKATCFYLKKSEAIAEGYKMGSLSDFNTIAKEVVKDFIKELLEKEICPYAGPITIEVKGEINDTKTEYYPAPCGGGSTSITTTITNKSTLNWKLNKSERRVTSGSATYDLYENYHTVSNFPCYICKNGQKGSAKITDDQTSEAKVEGLSNESTFQGKKIEDARVSIIFNDDETYTLLVEAATKRGTMKITTEKKIEGACEDESEPKKPKNKSIDVPIKAVFGPYKGTPEDKVLQQNETKDVSQGKEQVTVKIDFNLTRK